MLDFASGVLVFLTSRVRKRWYREGRMCSEAANAAQPVNASRNASLLLPRKHKVFYPLLL
jgi:hypothetical protein